MVAEVSALMSTLGLRKHYRAHGDTIRAVDGVSFGIARGETLALVGESGCGKTTLGKLLMRLEESTSGTIVLDGVDITRVSRAALRPHRRTLQMIYQDPFGSLNPRLTVGRIIEEPLIVHGLGSAAERRARVARVLERVGLRPELAGQYPHEFSGGQRQRIGIARALVLEPKAIICDEPVSALDVSIRAQVVNLLVDLQRSLGLAYLFISHDLAMVEYIADRVAVMYLGKIVELGPRRSLFAHPRHPYTQALHAAIPLPDPVRARAHPFAVLEGDPPSPANPPSGCRFRTRCRFAVERCAAEEPALREIAPGYQVACHLVDADGAVEGG